MSASIQVRRTEAGDPASYDVTITEGRSETRHRVTATRHTLERLGGGDDVELVESAFRFLLDREPKESILGSFDLTVIARYFPEFPAEISRYRGGPE